MQPADGEDPRQPHHARRAGLDDVSNDARAGLRAREDLERMDAVNAERRIELEHHAPARLAHTAPDQLPVGDELEATLDEILTAMIAR